MCFRTAPFADIFRVCSVLWACISWKCELARSISRLISSAIKKKGWKMKASLEEAHLIWQQRWKKAENLDTVRFLIAGHSWTGYPLQGPLLERGWDSPELLWETLRQFICARIAPDTAATIKILTVSRPVAASAIRHAEHLVSLYVSFSWKLSMRIWHDRSWMANKPFCPRWYFLVHAAHVVGSSSKLAWVYNESR